MKNKGLTTWDLQLQLAKNHIQSNCKSNDKIAIIADYLNKPNGAVSFETKMKELPSVFNACMLESDTYFYTKLARKYGYKIAFLNIEPKSLEEHIQTQKLTLENPSAHQVPADVLERNIEEWRIYNDLFKIGKITAINPLRHRHFEWDSENMCRKDTGEMAKHFDCDYIIALPSWWDKNELRKDIKDIIKDQKPWRFDCVIHTCDTTDKMSIIWGLKTFLADKHIILCAKNTDSGFLRNIEKYFLSGSEIEMCEIDTFNKASIEETMKQKAYGTTAFHLSGGSKAMFLAGQNAAKDLKSQAFIADTDKFNMLLLDECLPVRKIPSLSKVNDFLVANTYGLDIIKDTDTKAIRERKELTRVLFANHQALNKLTQKIQKKIKQNKSKNTYELHAENFIENKSNLTIEYNQKVLKISIKDKAYKYEGESTELLSYIIGGWFEEYLYLELMPLVQNGYIYDLQINTKLNTKGADYQEFDIVFTDGYRLFVIECKSGGVKSEAVEKLANIKQRYGGLNSICIIATPFGQNEIVGKKIQENGLHLVRGGYYQYIKEIIAG
ncbi:hypothetical protein T36_0616 [Helicobacter cinaedi]|uniref:Card1-like endonuclease domain-containing protein n=1 Tax=Helicobacter cinaedi TaxID=213 RepID=UPI001F3AD435|nr:DUF1887 family CARF protein [Helicobacter cinaedi]BDB64169.1 hypothetical protein T36_0616 [Helicobacter cinaedi]